MSFNEIFKKSFLDGYASAELTVTSIAACLLITALLGIYIFVAYRIICRKEFFNKNFSISLIAVSVTTAAIILAVQSNVVISLGMVGALSIVRFRTAIKAPLDLVFLFWAISVGIICGAGLAVIAVAVTAILSVLLWVFNALPVGKAPVILLVTAGSYEAESQVMDTLTKRCSKSSVKSRSLSGGQLDLTVEIRCDDEQGLGRALVELNGVESVPILAHDGEVTF